MNTVAASPETEATPKPHKLFAYEPLTPEETEGYPYSFWFKSVSGLKVASELNTKVHLRPDGNIARIYIGGNAFYAHIEVGAKELREMAQLLLATADFLERKQS